MRCSMECANPPRSLRALRENHPVPAARQQSVAGRGVPGEGVGAEGEHQL